MQVPIWRKKVDAVMMGSLAEWAQEKNRTKRGGLITKGLYEEILQWREDKGMEDAKFLLGDGLNSEVISKALFRSRKWMRETYVHDKWWMAVQPHDMRASMITQYADTYGLELTSKFIGHKKLDTTNLYYKKGSEEVIS